MPKNYTEECIWEYETVGMGWVGRRGSTTSVIEGIGLTENIGLLQVKIGYTREL